MKALLGMLAQRLFVVVSMLILVVALVPSAGAEDCGETAHPSTKDRCEEPGDSGAQGDDDSQIQGDAASDPDDNGNPPERTNGGADEPGGEGGDNPLDRDGNNGCGNDQDFEDDNEGLCGGDSEPAIAGFDDDVDVKPSTEAPSPQFAPDGDRVVTTVPEDEPVVEGDTTPPVEDRVLPPPPRLPDGTQPPPADDLPATGRNLGVAALAALAALLVGTMLVRRTRSATDS
jgi:hypothetical protein